MPTAFVPLASLFFFHGGEVEGFRALLAMSVVFAVVYSGCGDDFFASRGAASDVGSYFFVCFRTESL